MSAQKQVLALVQKTVSCSLQYANKAQKLANSPAVHTFLKNAKVELAPPTPADLPAIQQGLGKLVKTAQTGGFLNFTVTEAAQKSLVGVEIGCWFVVGEIIGRGSLIGYAV